MRIGTILLVFALQPCGLNVSAQFLERPISGAGSALGGSWLAGTDFWSALGNQAGLAYREQLEMGVHYENRFMLSELGTSMIGAALPVKPGTLGLTFSHFGFTGYSLIGAGLGYGMFLAKGLSAGVSVAYTRMQITGDYLNAQAVTAEAGIQYHPAERFTIAVYAYNPTGSTLGDVGNLTSLMGVALIYYPSRYVMLTIQVDDDTQRKPAARIGLEMNANQKAALRLGYSSERPEGFTVGVGFPLKTFIIDFGLSHHQRLGFTPKLSVSYAFSKTSGKK